VTGSSGKPKPRSSPNSKVNLGKRNRARRRPSPVDPPILASFMFSAPDERTSDGRGACRAASGASVDLSENPLPWPLVPTARAFRRRADPNARQPYQKGKAGQALAESSRLAEQEIASVELECYSPRGSGCSPGADEKSSPGRKPGTAEQSSARGCTRPARNMEQR